MKRGEFYSAGKLLLSGEYLVLEGAKALAVPLKRGQRMKVSAGQHPGILSWTAKILGNQWFNAGFRLPGLEISQSSDHLLALRLQQILSACAALSPSDFQNDCTYEIQTDLEFDLQWGFGSSSTLVSNLAYWLGIDPYALFRQVYPGSGYDVFCARATGPVLFQLINDVPHVSEAAFHPPFSKSLYFVYLGEKQDSQESVKRFRSITGFDANMIAMVSELTTEMIDCVSLLEFRAILNRHEELLADILKMPAIGSSRFPDFPGAIKSLGAWGGDFIMAASPAGDRNVKDYFMKQGLQVVFKYDELVR